MRTSFIIPSIGISATAILLSGCAGPPIDNVYRPVPAMFAPRNQFSVHGSTNDTVNSVSQLKIVAFDQFEHPEKISQYQVEFGTKQIKGFIFGTSAERNALYLSLDIAPIINGSCTITDPQERNALIQKVVYLSDRNFDTYISRSAAYNNYRKLYGGLLQDGATAGSGIAAFFSPFTSLGLSAANVSSAATQINSGLDNEMLGNIALEILQTGALQERMKFKLYLNGRLTNTMETYPALQALSDLAEYDNLGNLLTVLRAQKSESSAAVEALRLQLYPGLPSSVTTANAITTTNASIPEG